MQPFVRQTLLSEKALARGLFRPEMVRKLIDQHVAVKPIIAPAFVPVNARMWYERFID